MQTPWFAGTGGTGTDPKSGLPDWLAATQVRRESSFPPLVEGAVSPETARDTPCLLILDGHVNVGNASNTMSISSFFLATKAMFSSLWASEPLVH